VIVGDDHDSNTRFGDVHLVGPDVAATVVMVNGLLRELGIPLSAEIAAPLYAGLSSDTGSFTYRVTSPAAHKFAVRLLRTGFRYDLLARALWDTHPAGYLRLLGLMLSRLALEPEAAGGRRLAWTYGTAEEVSSFGVPLEGTGGAVADMVQTVEEAEVAAVCTSDGDGTVRVSVRSGDHVDVSEVAEGLGGGGHRFAAGLTETMALARKALAAWADRHMLERPGAWRPATGQ